MFAAIVTRFLLLVLGYAYPAYMCFKAVERPRLDTAQLRFWCQYWILIAGLTVSERIADPLISWVPMYCEAKLAFVVYLWHPDTQGTNYVYSTFLRPLVGRHESEIDRHLAEWKRRTRDSASHYGQMGRQYAQSCFAELMQLAQAQGLTGGPPGARSGAGGQLAPHPRIREESPEGLEDYDLVDVEPSGDMDPGHAQHRAASGFGSRLRSRSGRPA